MRIVLVLFVSLFTGVVRLGAQQTPAHPDGPVLADTTTAFLDDLERRTFNFFWETTPAENGLVPDRWPSAPFSSIAAVGFGLSAYIIGAERGYISREQAIERTLNTLRFFHRAPRGPQSRGVSGCKGFFYHFLDMKTGERFQTVELSTIDTALLLMGVLSAQQYYGRTSDYEREIRALADSLYLRVEWDWAAEPRPPLVSMGWHPERGFIHDDWHGYMEAMFLYVLGLGSPTHPLQDEAWEAFTRTYSWAEYYDQEYVQFAPLFGHQYALAWIDFRGIRDGYMREKGIDYFENSRRATLAQRAYAIDNPRLLKDYGPDIWGLTACDGPSDTTMIYNGQHRRFFGYGARGAAATEIVDDGTIAPTAAGGSIPFAPEVTVPALMAMKRRYREHLYQQYGYLDAFNPSFDNPQWKTYGGTLVPGVGWFNQDYLGIDQGPILLMAENYRTGLIWNLMRENPYIIRGLCRAGFTGGWLQGRCE